VSAQFDFPSIVLTQSAAQIHNLLHNYPGAIGKETLDWNLRALKIPYDGLDDLLVNFVGLSLPTWGSIQSSLVEFNAPIRVRFSEECKLFDGKLNIVIEDFDSESPERVSVGLIQGAGKSVVGRDSVELENEDWTRAGGCLMARKEISVGDVSHVGMFLQLRGYGVDVLHLRDPSAYPTNPRMLAYRHFDEGLNALSVYLGGEGKDPSADFEIGVSLLLHFCGLTVGVYGRVKRLQSEVDLVAFAPFSNHVVVAECTITDLDVNEKLSKFSRRAKELREVLHDFTIIPLVFTALERGKVSQSDFEKAKREGIGVVTSDEIADLVTLAAQQKGVNKSLGYLYSLVPKEDTFFSIGQETEIA